MKRNFVVVAHDEQVREALAGDLRARGYSVTRAKSARQAEQIVRSVAVDAILIESHLPDMPPEELRIRLSKVRPDCRVVVLTDYRQVRNTAEQLYHDGNEFLLRPVSRDELTLRIEFAMARRMELRRLHRVSTSLERERVRAQCGPWESAPSGAAAATAGRDHHA